MDVKQGKIIHHIPVVPKLATVIQQSPPAILSYGGSRIQLDFPAFRAKSEAVGCSRTVDFWKKGLTLFIFPCYRFD